MELKKQAPLVIICAAAVLFILLSIVCSRCKEGDDPQGIVDLKSTIDELTAKNQQLESLNQGLEQRVGELQGNNERLEHTIGALQETVAGAGSDINDALGTSERIRILVETLTE